MLRDQLVAHLRQIGPAPFLFVGSGLSRRYLGVPSWEGLLQHFADVTGQDYSFLSATADGKLPEVATLLAHALHERWWTTQDFAATRATFAGVELAVRLLGPLGQRMRTESHESVVVVRYREGNGALRTTLGLAAERGYEALVVETKNVTKPGKAPRYQALVRLRNAGERQAEPFLDVLADVPGVLSAKFAHPDTD